MFDNSIINVCKINSKDVLATISSSIKGISISELSKIFECDHKTMKHIIFYLQSRNLIHDNGLKTKGKLFFANIF